MDFQEKNNLRSEWLSARLSRHQIVGTSAHDIALILAKEAIPVPAQPGTLVPPVQIIESVSEQPRAPLRLANDPANYSDAERADVARQNAEAAYNERPAQDYPELGLKDVA